MRDPRLYSRKLRYYRAAACKSGGRRLEGMKLEIEGSGKTHFVRNYALLANYLHQSH